jgi:Spermine/spermidine synthase domain
MVPARFEYPHIRPKPGKDAMPSLTSPSKQRLSAGSPNIRTDRKSRVAALVRAGRRWAAAGLAWSRSTAGGSFGSGIVAGCYLIAFCHPLTSRFGSGLTFTAGALAAATAGMIAGAIGRRSRTASSRWPTIVLCLVLAVWAIAFGKLADVTEFCSRLVTLDALASPVVQFGVAFGSSLLLIGPPAACAVRLGRGAATIRVGWLLSGAAAGLVVAAHTVAPLIGIQWIGPIAAVGSVAIIVSRPRRLPRSVEPRSTLAVTLPSVLGPVIASMTVGVAAVALGRLSLQLFPSAEAEHWTAWAGFLLGSAAGWALTRPRISGDQRRTVARTALVAAFCLVLPVLLFAVLTNWFLAITATVSQVNLLMLIRGGAGAMLLFPLGAAWVALVNFYAHATVNASANKDSAQEEEAARPDSLLRAVPSLLAGVLVARWLLARGVAVPVLVDSGAVLLAALGAAMSFRRTTAGGRWRTAGALAAVVCLVAVGQVEGTYSAARSARLLFSTDVFMERHVGTETRLLPFLDDGRMAASQNGDRGTYTLWKHHGVQLELRENGIPLGTYCGRSDLCPQFSGQVLTAAIPLSLHEAPRRVLVLGLGSGSTLAACLEFPVAEVTCVEGDGGLIELLERSVWPSGLVNPQSDTRVRVIELEPAAAVQSRSGAFDVILADTDPAAVASGNPYYTREFYAGASAQLEADGIFAQRFRYIDFGPWPVRSALATMKSAFAEVTAIEAGGGDLLLLGTNSSRGLDRPELLKRFQAPQVGRSLSHVGWDWSVALNLGTFSGEGREALISGAPTNTAANGLFAYRLPQETMRWGLKRNELAETLNGHAGRIAEWPNAEGNDPELLRRLNDVIMQRELMTAYPDQPWAYRKAVHEELKKHPHTVIREDEDGYDRQLNPVDKRRLNYFAALGKAAKSRRPTLDMLHQLEEFSEPYDPVLTYFVHHELAALYARAATLDPAARLRHRLYTVYYGDARDRSIRDVVESLHLLMDNPQALAASERWDHMNALLQFLKVRWNNRGLIKPPSLRIVLNDLEGTISAAESTFAEMEKLRSEVGVAESDWQARREVLERVLVRPLRAYQSSLLPDYLKEIQPPPTVGKEPAASTKQNAN